MANEIVPVSRSLYLCDFHVGYQDGKVDLYGIFTALQPAAYPYVHAHFVVFAQLTNGLGDVPFYFEIRRDRDDELIRRSADRTIRFVDRVSIIQVVMTLDDVLFSEAGVYVVSLFCHNTWVCDTAVTLE
jgi:hypothetical protein